MSNLEQIYLILAVFFLAECGQWVRPGSLIFVSPLGRRCRTRTAHADAWLRNDHGGFVLGNVLPAGHAILGHFWPLVFSPDGVASTPCEAQTADGWPVQRERFVPWADVRNVTTEVREVRIDGKLLVHAATPELARLLSALLTRLQAAPPEERGAAVETALREWLTPAAFAEALREHRRRSRLLQVFCTLLLLYVFAGAPLLTEWKIATEFLELLPPYLGLLVLTLLVSYRTHRALGRTGREWWSASWLMLVSPADAMHARDRLFRGLGVAWHPLALASVLCRPADFAALARQVLLDLQFPLPRAEARQREPRVVAAEEWFRDRLRAAVGEFLNQTEIDLAALVPTPRPDREECRSYCPRCQGQYVVDSGVCSTCGLELRRFTSAPEAIPWLTAPARPEPVKVPVRVEEPKKAPPVVAGRRRKRKKKK